MIQLDFFEEDFEKLVLKQEVKDLKESFHKVRKALFAKHGDLAKMYLDLCSRLDIIERGICKGNLPDS